MKKVIIFTIILLSYTRSYAQVNDFFLRIGASASHSLIQNNYFLYTHNPAFNNQYSSVKQSFLFGKTIGGGFSYAFPKKENIFIQTDLNYVERGLKIKDNINYYINNMSSRMQKFNKLRYNYLDATILLKQYNPFGNFKFGYGLGGTFGYFINSKVESPNDIAIYYNGQIAGTYKDNEYNNQQEEKINANNRKFDFAISGEMSLDYSWNAKTTLGLNLRFNRSVLYSTKQPSPYQSTLQNASASTPQNVGIASRNLLLTLVYKYRIPTKQITVKQ